MQNSFRNLGGWDSVIEKDDWLINEKMCFLVPPKIFQDDESNENDSLDELPLAISQGVKE